MAVFTVSNTLASGSGSLAQAILDLNSTALAGPHSIEISLPGNPTFNGPLPPIVRDVALTRAGFPVTFAIAGGDSLNVAALLTIPSGSVIGGNLVLQAGGALSPSAIEVEVLSFDTMSDTTWGGTLQGLSSLHVFSGGLTLTAPQPLTGATSVQTGARLTLAAGSSLQDSWSVQVNGTLDLTAADQTLLDLQGSGTVDIGARTLTLQPAFNFQTSVDITGAGGVVIDTAARVGFLAPQTFTGTLRVDRGEAELNASIAASAVSIAAAGVLTIGGAGVDVGSLAGDGLLQILAGAISVHEAGTGTFQGRLSGLGDFRMAGTGTLVLEGDSPAFGGFVFVDSGVLVVQGDLGGALTVVNPGATLAGTGTIVQPILDGVLSPGDGVGVLTVLNPVFFPTGVLRAELGAASDRLDVVGAIALGGTLDLVTLPTFAPAIGDEIILISNDGTDALTGSFQYAEGATVTLAAGVTARLSYVGGSDNNDLTLTVLTAPPAPSVFDVITTSPAGVGSLTDAINAANAQAGPDIIDISASLGPNPSFAFPVPTITDAVTLASGSNPITLTLDPFAPYLETTAPLALLDGSVVNGRIRLSGPGAVLSDTTLRTNELLFAMPGASVTWGGVLQGTGDLVVEGGTVTLTAAQAYTGVTVVQDTLVLASGSSIATSAAIFLDVGATLDTSAGGQTLPFLDGTGTVLIGSRTLTLTTPAAPLWSTGVSISGAGGDVVVDAGGRFEFYNAQAFTGTLSVAAGEVALTNGATVACDADIGALATLSIERDVELTGLNGDGDVFIDAGQTLTLRETGGSTFRGDLGGGGRLVVTGGGNVFLGGDAAAFGGEIAVDAGLLSVQGDVSNVLTIATGAATLGGTGAVRARVESGATLAPGAGVGTLTVADLDMRSGSRLAMEFDAAHDGITAVGTVTVAGTLDLAALAGFAPAQGDEIVLIDNDGTDAIAGTFQYAQDDIVTLGTQRARVSYTGGSGNDLTLTVLPNVFAVTTTAPSGPGSLAQAILDANAAPGANVIDIDPALVMPHFTGVLPVITGDVTIRSGGNAAVFSLDSAGGTFLQTNAALTLPDNTVIAGTVIVSGPAASVSATTFAAESLRFDKAGQLFTWDGVLTGAGELIVDAGNLLLTAPQQYTGATTIADGLRLDAGASIASSTSVTVQGGAILDVSAGDQTLPDVFGSGVVRIGGSTLTLQWSGGANFNLFEGTGVVAVQATGTLTFWSPGAFAGTVRIETGRVEFGPFSSFNNVVEVGVGGTLGVPVPLTLAALSGDGTLDIDPGVNLTVGGGTFAGSLAGRGNLVLASPGTLTLSGNATAFTGGLFVAAAGELRIENDVGHVVTIVEALLTGTGVVRPVVLAGGMVAPGGAGIGTLSAVDPAFQALSTLRSELGPASDKLAVQGAVTLAGTLDLVALPGFAPALGDEIVLIANDGTDPIVGTFQYAQDEVVTLGAQRMRVSYTGGDGNDLTLTVLAPPPPPPPPNPLDVTNVLSSGVGSLTDAIQAANAMPGADVIDIDPALGTPTFFFTLPAITDAVTISSGGNPAAFAIDPAGSLITHAPLTLPDGTVIGGRISLNGAAAALSDTDIQAGELRFFMGGTSYTWGGTLGGNGDLRVDGGTITLTAPQTYTGATIVADRLVLASTASLAASSNVEVDGASTLDISAGDQTLRGLTGTGTVQLGASTLTLNTAAPILSSVQIAGTGDVVVNAGGALTFTSSQLFTGTLRVATGLVQLQGGFAGAADLGATGVLRFQNNADLTGLSGTGILTVDAGQTLTVRESGTSTFAGDLSGAGMVAVTGGGTLVLQGGAGTFAGAVAVDGATLRADADLAHVGVNVGTGGIVSGTGTVQATVQAGGTLAPGNGVGTLGVVDLDVQAGGTVRMELGATTDRINALGTVTLNGALALTELAGFAPADGVPIVLIDNDGTSDAVIGTFTGLADGATVTLGARTAVVDYDGGDGNDVTLTFGAVTPPPPPPPVTPPPAPSGIVATAPPEGGTLIGTPYDDVLTGLGGRDTFVPLGGNDVIDGGPGKDTVRFDGPRSSYVLALGADGVLTVQSVAQPVTTDRIVNVERLLFDDGMVLLAPSPQHKLVSCMYNGLLGRRADEGGLEFHAASLDAGTSLQATALAFLHSPEHAAQAARTPQEVIAGLYLHFLGRAADAGGLAHHTATFQQFADAKAATAQLVVNFAASAEMQVRLVGQPAEGIALLPPA